MKKKLLLIFLVISMFSSCMLGCGSEDNKDKKEASTAKSESDTYIFKDSAGREVELPKKIDRIAPSGGLAQVFLFSLAPDKFVGLSSAWSDSASEYLDEKYLSLPEFGQFYGQANLNMEAIAAADPQVIIDIGEKKSTVVEDMDSIQEQLGIPTIFIEATLESTADAYRTLGEILNMEDEAKKIADFCEDVYKETIDTMETIKEEDRVNLTYCVGDTGTSVIPQGAYFSEILDLLGTNVASVEDPSSKGSGNEVSLEQLYIWDPELIIFAPNTVYSSVGSDTAWSKLSAISNNNYFEIPNEPYGWMGPSVSKYLGLMWLSNLLYPNDFDFDLYDKTKKYYELFYHYDLSEEQYNKITANSLRK